ncbi:hypothetical protein B0A55_00212 [Friedmanniomyces simplex]|uniref:C3H1-type domain-containing protein n=1 Tax=Friedmanniomyces simplex TaxID=329884 RepID=A0A4U0Y398_9PEZI|nr:hypothetical protein B0A55_00212 [Friedmanniomyces simplex]
MSDAEMDISSPSTKSDSPPAEAGIEGPGPSSPSPAESTPIKGKASPKKATPKKRAAEKASEDDEEGGEGSEDGESLKKKQKSAKGRPGKERQRKAPPAKPKNARVIGRNYDECSKEDKALLDMRDAGKGWPEIRAGWEKLTGDKTGHSTLPNRYARLKSNFVVIKEEDNQHLLKAKIEVEAAFEKEKWGLIATAMEKNGTDLYKGEVLQKQYKKLMLEANIAPPPGVKSKDFESEEEMVFVDWEAHGICKFWMLGGAKRCYANPCKWIHPPESEVKSLWDDPAARWPYIVRERPAQEAPAVPLSVSEHESKLELSPISPPQVLHKQPAPTAPASGWAAPTEQQRQQHAAGAPVLKKRAVTPPWLKSKAPLVAEAARSERQNTLSFAKSVVQSVDSLPDNRPDTRSSTAEQHPTSDPPQHRDGKTAMSANRQPLGRPNRLFARPALPTPDNSSSPAAFPTAGARTVWRRPEATQQPTLDQDAMMELDSSPPRPGGFWAKQREKQGGSEQSEVGSEVQMEARGMRLAKSAPAKTSTGVHMLPPPRPLPTPHKRSKSPPTAIIIASSPEQAAQIVSELDKMGALKRMSNGEAKIIGPHPSTIRVAARYASQAAVENALHPATVLDVQERSLAEAREDSVRLQGVTWLDTTRRALQLPIRSFTTACSYFHYFRLAHPGAMDYAWADAAAAALLVSCKAEDTLKKSRDILAAAYNVKAGSHDALSADDVVFEAPSRIVIGLERLMLESSSFDFRSKYPHKLLVKVCKSLPESEEKKQVSSVAWSVVTDLHRTFASLKQSTATVALASLELAAHLQASASGNGTSVVREQLKNMDIGKWSSSREEIMETLLDLLDLYTHHTTSTILGTKYSLDDFLRIRLALNKECNDKSIPRFTIAPEHVISNGQQGATLRVANGHPTPVSPPQPDTHPAQAQQSTNGILPYPAIPEGGGTLRFMLNPQLAAEEKTEVQKFYVEEWEEYDEEIEVPIPAPARPPKARATSKDRHSNHGGREHGQAKDRTERHPPRPARERERERDLSQRSSIDDRRPQPADDKRSIDEKRSREDLRERDRDRERDRPRDRNRERDRGDRDYERDRVRTKDRDRDRERRYEDRRYEERDRYDRRDGGRRYDDYERRHEGR